MSSVTPNVQARAPFSFRGPCTAIANSLTLDPAGRAVYLTGNGTITGKLIGDTSDQTFSGLLAGTVYTFAFKSITSATATGFVLY